MEDGARRVAHLVELVDAADAVVGEDERARLKHHLLRLGIFGDVSSQTDGAGSLTRGVLRPGIEKGSSQQTWLTGKNAVPVRLNPIGQHDENNCLACVA